MNLLKITPPENDWLSEMKEEFRKIDEYYKNREQERILESVVNNVKNEIFTKALIKNRVSLPSWLEWIR